MKKDLLIKKISQVYQDISKMKSVKIKQLKFLWLKFITGVQVFTLPVWMKNKGITSIKDSKIGDTTVQQKTLLFNNKFVTNANEFIECQIVITSKTTELKELVTLSIKACVNPTV